MWFLSHFWHNYDTKYEALCYCDLWLFLVPVPRRRVALHYDSFFWQIFLHEEGLHYAWFFLLSQILLHEAHEEGFGCDFWPAVLGRGHSSGGTGRPVHYFSSRCTRISNFDHFAHNNHGEGGGYGMKRIVGWHHYNTAAMTSVAQYNLMMWRNFGKSTHSLYFGYHLHELTVILKQTQQLHAPLMNRGPLGHTHSSITTLFDSSDDATAMDKPTSFTLLRNGRCDPP